MGPLLSSSDFEPYLTSLVQEMFLVAQNSDNHQLQQFASWVLAFLRHHLWSKELLGVDSDRSVAATNSKSVSQSFSEDNIVLKLSLWLTSFKYTEVDLLPIFCVNCYMCVSFIFKYFTAFVFLYNSFFSLFIHLPLLDTMSGI